MFRDTLHKIKIFFRDDDVEKIYVRDGTVIRDNEIHRMYNEILDELGDLATVVSFPVCYRTTDLLVLYLALLSQCSVTNLNTSVGGMVKN